MKKQRKPKKQIQVACHHDELYKDINRHPSKWSTYHGKVNENEENLLEKPDRLVVSPMTTINELQKHDRLVVSLMTCVMEPRIVMGLSSPARHPSCWVILIFSPTLRKKLLFFSIIYITCTRVYQLPALI